MTPSALTAATQAALERTQRRLQELTQADQRRQQRRVEIDQGLIDRRTEALQAERQVPIAVEALNAAKAMRVTLADTPAAERAATQVAQAEQSVAQAKHTAAVTLAGIEKVMVEASQEIAALEHEDQLDQAERAELEPLVPHLNLQLREHHRQAGVEQLEELRARIREQEAALKAAQAAAAQQEQALAELRSITRQEMAQYPELNLEIRQLLPEGPRPIETLMAEQIRFLDALIAHVGHIAGDVPPVWNGIPFSSMLSMDPQRIRQWIDGGDLSNLHMRRQATESFLADIKDQLQRRARQTY